MQKYVYHAPDQEGHHPIKTWTDGVFIEDQALRQLKNLASLPFIHRHVAAMPDVHWAWVRQSEA